MLGGKQKRKAFISVALAFAIWHTVDEWTILIAAFVQWDLKPEMNMFRMGVLNGVGNLFILIGTFPMGHIVDSAGTKFAAILATTITGFYYLFLSQVTTFFGFLCAQIFRIGFQFPQITESFIGSVETEEKERTRALMRLTIPLGLALVAGPYLAGVLSRYFSDHNLIAVAGIVLILTLLPIIVFLIPELTNRRGMSVQKLPKLSDYGEMFSCWEFNTALLVKMLVDIPYQAYDQLSRTYLIHHMLKNHSDMFHLFVLIGISTLVTNVLVIKYLQNYFLPQRLLQFSLVILTISYLLLSTATGFTSLMIIMPVQVVGILIAYSEIVGCIMGAVKREHLGKAAGLSQVSQILAATIMPPLAGYIVSYFGFTAVCLVSAIMTLAATGVVQFSCRFMNRDISTRLPQKINAS